MTLDAGIYRLEGFQGETAEHLVEVQDTRLVGDTVEMEAGVQWEPDTDDIGSPSQFTAQFDIRADGQYVTTLPDNTLPARSGFVPVEWIELPGVAPGSSVEVVIPTIEEEPFDPVVTRETLSFAAPSAFDPADVTVSCEFVNPTQLEAGESIDVTVEVSNANPVAADASLTWDVAGQTRTTTNTITAGSSEQITETFFDLPAGTFQPTVDLTATELELTTTEV